MRFGQAVSGAESALDRMPVVRSEIYRMGGKERQGGQGGKNRGNIEMRRNSGPHPGFDPGEIQNARLSRAEADILRRACGVRKAEKGETPLSAEELIYAQST